MLSLLAKIIDLELHKLLTYPKKMWLHLKFRAAIYQLMQPFNTQKFYSSSKLGKSLARDR